MYGVIGAEPRTIPDLGVDARPVRGVTAGALGAIVTDHCGPPAPELAALQAFAEVVRSLATTGAVLPARFGTAVDAEPELRTMLDRRSDELHALLERVDEAVEFAVHRPDEPPQAGAVQDDEGPGAHYMRRLLAESRHMRDATLCSLSRERPRRVGRSASYLVARADIDAFLASAAERGMTVTGPYPPYSFVMVPA
jgi:hypothetical protein